MQKTFNIKLTTITKNEAGFPTQSEIAKGLSTLNRSYRMNTFLISEGVRGGGKEKLPTRIDTIQTLIFDKANRKISKTSLVRVLKAMKVLGLNETEKRDLLVSLEYGYQEKGFEFFLYPKFKGVTI